MGETAGLALRLGKFCSALAIFMCGAAAAQPQTEQLKGCLAAFEGIEWKLPYRPFLHVHGCAWPGGFYGAGGDSSGGRRSLELIGAVSLGPTRDRMPADASYAQFQQAVFVHFDSLFRSQGFRRMETQEALDGAAYTALARYTRSSTGTEAMLTWQTEAKNTWRITLEPHPQGAGASR